MNEEQIAQLILLLILAGAAQDEQLAMLIIQGASQGDPQAQQIVQLVVQLAQQALTLMARLGAKIRYMSRLKGICPEGEELTYYKAGGKVCKKCMKCGGKPQMDKCGGKAKKKMSFGGGVPTNTTKVKKPVIVGGKTTDSIQARNRKETANGTYQEGYHTTPYNERPPVKPVKTTKRAKGGILANKGTAFGDGKKGANPRNTDRGGHKSHGNTKAASYMKKTNIPNKFTAFGDTGKAKPTNVGLVGHKKTGKTGRMLSKYTVSDNVNKHTAFGAHINRNHRQQSATPASRGWTKIKGAPKGASGQKMGWKRYADGGNLTLKFFNKN